MKRQRLPICCILLVSFCLSGNAQEFRSKYFFTSEVISMGPEFLTGNFKSTLEPGLQVNLFPTLFSSYKRPNLFIGAGFYFGQHDFSPTNREKNIIDSYEIVTTTTTQYGTSTTTSEPLEDITIARYGLGIPLGYQTINIDKKISFMFAVIPMFYSLSNGLKGEDYRESESGLGVAAQIGANINVGEKTMIRLSYYHGSLPEFNLFLLDELRKVEGPGTYGSIQIGLVMRDINEGLLRN